MNAYDLLQHTANVLACTMNKNTHIAYRRHWDDFSVLLESDFVTDVADIRKSTLAKYLSPFTDKPRVYNQARSAIFKLLGEVSETGCMPQLSTLMKQVKAAKVSKDISKLFLSSKQLKQIRANLIEATYEDYKLHMRDILIYDILYNTLIRVDELVLLQIKDIDIENKMIAVRGKGALADNKGNRAVSAYIPISSALTEQIIAFVNAYRVSVNDGSEDIRPSFDYPKSIKDKQPLFTSSHHKTINVSTVKKIVHNAIASIFESGAVPRNAGPHAIRRSVATMLWNEQKNMPLLQKMLRHASPTTTMEYIGIGNQEYRSAFEGLGVEK